MAQIPAIEVEDLQHLLQSATPPLVIDVREQREYDICQIPGSQLIPLADLPQRAAELPKDRRIVMHCHHGGRSARATAFLLQNGFDNVVNLVGGIHAWSERIDPTVKTYT
jgi:rhodanese-related sulfurtransferase